MISRSIGGARKTTTSSYLSLLCLSHMNQRTARTALFKRAPLAAVPLLLALLSTWFRHAYSGRLCLALPTAEQAVSYLQRYRATHALRHHCARTAFSCVLHRTPRVATLSCAPITLTMWRTR